MRNTRPIFWRCRCRYQCRDSDLLLMMSLISFLATIFHLVALVLSLMMCWRWFQRSDPSFWASLPFFALRHMIYFRPSWLAIKKNTKRKGEKWILSILVFFFASFSPFIIALIQNLQDNWKGFSSTLAAKLLARVYLPPDTTSIDDPVLVKIVTLLKLYKFSILNIPQWVIQLVNIFFYHSAEAQFSFMILTISIVVQIIIYPGFLWAYSIHRPAFIFNILAITADVLWAFSMGVWLQSPPTLVTQYSFFVPSLHLWNWWILVWLMATGAVGALYTVYIWIVASVAPFGSCLPGLCCCLLSGGALVGMALWISPWFVLSLGIISIFLVQIFRFSIPLLKSLNWKVSDAIALSEMYIFLNQSRNNKEGLDKKTTLLSRHFAYQYLQSYLVAELTLDEDGNPRTTIEAIRASPNYIKTRTFCMGGITKHLSSQSKYEIMQNQFKDISVVGSIIISISSLIFAPVMVIFSVYGYLVPLLSLITTPYGELTAAQAVLTVLQYLMVIPLSLLLPSAYHYYIHILSPDRRKQIYNIAGIQKEYYGDISLNWIVAALLIGTHRAVSSEQDAILDLLPTIKSFLIEPQHQQQQQQQQQQLPQEQQQREQVEEFLRNQFDLQAYSDFQNRQSPPKTYGWTAAARNPTSVTLNIPAFLTSQSFHHLLHQDRDLPSPGQLEEQSLLIHLN